MNLLTTTELAKLHEFAEFVKAMFRQDRNRLKHCASHAMQWSPLRL
jgi:cell division protein ZapA (FtsZ GTPase activity inhibitor)